ncbi:membrane-associated, eicosanoid/glutathione metabolism protein [Cladochytrium replicatum]|nr:membrane-associated, eicosanoid/glutathione metabolism protein [Cladochytrium replicatum]
MSGINVPITAFYGGILAIYGLYLQTSCILVRRRIHVSLGDGTRETIIEALHSLHENNFANINSKEITTPFESKFWELTRAIRIHGNFIESAPIVILLAGLAELNGAPLFLVHASLATFGISRLLHMAALKTKRAYSVLRPLGVTGGAVPILALAIYGVYSGARTIFGL